MKNSSTEVPMTQPFALTLKGCYAKTQDVSFSIKIITTIKKSSRSYFWTPKTEVDPSNEAELKIGIRYCFAASSRKIPVDTHEESCVKSHLSDTVGGGRCSHARCARCRGRRGLPGGRALPIYPPGQLGAFGPEDQEDEDGCVMQSVTA